MATQSSTSPMGGTLGTSPFNKLSVNRDDPALQAVLSKLVRDGRSGAAPAPGGRKRVNTPNLSTLQRLSEGVTNDVNDVANLFQLLPDIRLAMQIYVSSVLSPKDMSTSKFSYTTAAGTFQSELSGALTEVIRQYFDVDYNIGSIAPSIVEDGLFFTGSYPLLVLPESSVDLIINGRARVSNESISSLMTDAGTLRPIGFLGNPASKTAASRSAVGLEALASYYRVSTEEYDPTVRFNGEDALITVVDNPDTVKLARLQERVRAEAVQDRIRNWSTIKVGTESQVQSYTYRAPRQQAEPVVMATPAPMVGRPTVGHPLVLKLSSESVIPVHVPSNPEEHLGYFILIDPTNGSPIARATEQDYYTQLQTNLSNSQSMASSMIQNVKRQAYGTSDTTTRLETEELERAYGDLLEAELDGRLSAGLYGQTVKVSRPQEVYRVMLARTLASMRTQLLYVPAEMMTYIAFDYDLNGIGVSMLAQSKILGGMRAMMLFANTMASVKNSIGRTLLNIELDPNDPDPTATVEMLVHEYARVNQGAYPLSTTNAQDIISYFQQAGTEIQVSGNTGYPQTKVVIEDSQSNRAKPDPELEDSLRKRHLMSMDLNPEMVDASYNAEFATSIVSNNLLFAKRVKIVQQKLTAGIKDFVCKYTLASETLMERLREVIRNNRDSLKAGQKDAAVQAHTEQRRSKLKLNSGIVVGASEVKQTKNSLLLGGGTGQEALNEGQIGTDAEELPVDAIILEFLKALQVSLPDPDVATLAKQLESYDQYAEALDKAIHAYIDSGFLDSLNMGELSEVVEPTINAIKAHYLRQWLRENNVLPELDQLVLQSGNEDPTIDLFDITASHLEGLGKSIMKYMRALLEARRKSDPLYERLKGSLDGEAASETSFGSGDGGESGGGGFGDDDFGGDDLGDDDLSANEGEEQEDTSTETTEEPAADTEGGEPEAAE